MKYWQTIFHFTLQNSSDLEGSDGCDDDSDWASKWLDVGPLLLAIPFVYKKVAFLNPRISKAGVCVLAEQEPDAQEKLGGEGSAVEKVKEAFYTTDWFTWLIYLKIV